MPLDLGPAVVEMPPDLGPAVVIDQLRVLVHDACATAWAAPDPQLRARGIQEVELVLTTLRRSLP